MVFEVEITRKADKSISGLPGDIRRRVLNAISKLPNFPDDLDIKKLHGLRGMYRVRIGDYRILISVERKKLVVINVLHRSKAYKGKR